ncbi:flagellar hook-length control protein FliK [Bradyrhizobium neotropicale]|uniref:flagellar hook-length control protein FliK n=1 Tax=Bradyrhizobium neotropicale TaxID=1497615 RepID=UPI001AD60B68|nr:flagellar hook-length control protein FliK [Bradyrhizobium neotropicale]MBO4228289.1 flagellar hook-length control protein FliK [Bradyrhizobium neotropicale]
MALTINPVLPVLSAKEVGSVAPDLVLQPGSVINAQVLKVLSADLVRIAISSLSIDVLSEVPLKEGQALQLAVSQTKDGIRLAMLGQGDAAADDAVTLSPDAQLATANPSTTTQSRNVLTTVERTAVANATQNAATVQQSLAPLFANLGALAGAAHLPPRLQQAIAQVLTHQTRLDSSLDGGDIKTAFERSGLFFEASLAASTASPATGAPDLKAALIVLRQTLKSSLGTADAPPSASTAAGQGAAHPALTQNLPPSDIEVEEILLPQARVPVADDLVTPGGIGRGTSSAGPSAGATLNLLQELGNSARPTDIAADVTVHTNTPPPPFRGALPTAQPVASPSVAPDMPLAATAHHLLGDTDAALARQTLLQVASLPDRIDPAHQQIDTSSPRWHFEIPFATPQGTAMAQFEISRDGGGGVEAEAAKRVWRARFSLDVEPAGPIHALISLIGDQTSVRMWAERPATAAQLRASVPQLSQALSRAELLPGDIVIQDGAPPQAAPARAGHFLDRAL